MKSENGNKKVRHIVTRQLVLMVTTVFLLVVVIMGSSYALFMDVDTSTQDNVYTSGDLVVVFNDKTGEKANTINNASLIPMSNEAALKQTDNVYSFTITNTGTLPMKYNVKLNDMPEYSNNSNLLKHEFIKYQLCINNTNNCTIIRNLSSVDDGILYQSNIKSGEQTIYYLRIWLTDENITNDIQNKELHLEVNVDGISANESYLAYYLTDNGKVSQKDVNTWYAKEDNYIKFNNEMWRIIGVFDKLSNGENIGSRIKIIKDTPLDYNVVFDNNGNNNYLESSLRTLLNTTYFDTLDVNYKKLAEKVIINETETNIFLMNNTDIEYCNWLKIGLNEYTMTASDNGVSSLDINNSLISSSSLEEKSVRPVIFLSETTEYLKGTGTKDDPYIILKDNK